MSNQHPFERAKLGVAPFRCISMQTNWYSAGPGHKQPGGSCDYCGTGIAYEYVILDSTGKQFKVGSDCVLRTGSHVEGFKAVKSKHLAAVRAVRSQAKHAERQARYEARAVERAAVAVSRRAAFNAEYPEVAAFLSACTERGFLGDMAAALQQWGSLSPNQLAAVQRTMLQQAQRAAEVATSRHIGAVGERISGTFEVIAQTSRLSDFGYPRAMVYWHLLKAEGNFYTYRGSRDLGQRGEKVAAKFTVKAHEEYKGAKQTVLARPAIFLAFAAETA